MIGKLSRNITFLVLAMEDMTGLYRDTEVEINTAFRQNVSLGKVV